MILDPHKKIIRLLILLFILLLSRGYTAFAASWTSGGPYGGDINSLAMSLTNPDVMYAATKNNLFKTYNEGENWTSLDADGSVVQIVQVAPSDPDIVLICIRSPSDSTDYLYKSTDGGETLGQIVRYSDEGEAIYSVAIDPQNPDIFYVGIGYFVRDVAIDSPVIFKTTDGGESYTAQLFADLQKAYSILIDTDNPEHIYVGGQTEGWDNCNGFYMSKDGGGHWVSKDLNPEHFGDNTNILALAMTPAGSDPPVLYALAYINVVGFSGVYKSLDRGESWIHILEVIAINVERGVLAVDPLDPNIIYAGPYFNGFYMTTDGGQEWFKKSNDFPSSKLSTMVIDPRNGAAFMGFSSGGVFKSTDRGDTWHASNHGMGCTYIEDLAISLDSSDSAFAVISAGEGAFQIKGEGYHLAKTTDRGNSWEYLPHSPTPLGAVAIDPQTPSVLWVGDGVKYDSSSYVYKTDDGGQSWMDKQFFSFIYTGVSSILIHPEDSDVILIASKERLFNGGLYGDGVLARSLNGGDTWDALSNLSTICIAMDPNDHQVVYAGRRLIGQVFKYTNVWGEYVRTEITPSEGIGDVHAIEVDLNSRVYVAASDGLWRWDGSGWIKFSGLPTDDITALSVDRLTSPGTVYVGTGGDGVFVSNDGGSIWTPLNEGLGNHNITKLAISETIPKTLYAGTAYGGVWSLILEEPAPDTDGDGLPDALENATCTDVNNPDTDGDGLSDGVEDANHNGIVDPAETNPCDADSDDDGILDGNEDKNHDGIIDTAAGETDPCNPDTDGDGIYDGTEIGLTAPQDPQATDQTQGYFVPDADPSTTTDPTNPDTDGDGISDGQEDANHNGRVDAGETDPSDNSSRPTIILLNKGFNMIAIPADVTSQPDLKDWFPVLGDNTEIEKVMVYDEANSRFVTLIPGDSSNPSFELQGGEGLIIYATGEKQVGFMSVDCSSLDLEQGFNLIGIACPEEGYSAFQLLTELGNGNVSSIQRYSTEKGAFETAGFGPEGQLVGIDFPIVPGEGYFVYMKQEVLGF